MAWVSAGTATFAKWAVIPAALLVSGLAVSQASYSAFSATTAGPINNWKAGTVKLADSAAGAVFNATGALAPGNTETKCITVAYEGSLASTVKLYAKDFNTPAPAIDISPWINLVITEGDLVGGTGDPGDCTGFTPLTPAPAPFQNTLQVFGATTFANGVGTWQPAGASPETPVKRTYKIDYTVNGDTPAEAQGGTASVSFTWEAQNR